MTTIKKNIAAGFTLLTAILIIAFMNNHQKEGRDFDEMKRVNQQIQQRLLERYNAEIITDSTFFTNSEKQVKLLSDVVLLDTVIQSISQVDKEYYLNAEINCDSKTKIRAKFKLDSKDFSRLYHRKSNHALAVVKIDKIQCRKVLSDYNFDKSDTAIVAVGEEVFLSGECLEVAQVYKNYDQFLNTN